MKVLIFIFVLHFYFSNAADHKTLMKWVEKCSSETGFDNKAYSELKELINDPDSKKLFLCVANAGNMLNKDGYLDKDVIKQVLPNKVKDSPFKDKWVNECIIKGSSPEESVFETFICIEKRIYYMLNGTPLDI